MMCVCVCVRHDVRVCDMMCVCVCVNVQEMFLEIEQRVACLSALGQATDQQQQDELGAAGSQQEAAELLSSKLELLKADLVCFQQLLQARQGEERIIAHIEPQEQVTPCNKL